MKKAVVFGPGRIGCGFVGQLLHASGYEIVFVGRDAIVDHLSRVGRYVVRLTDGMRARDVEVRGVRALRTSDVEGVADAIADADLVAVSVGPRNLGAIAPLLAAGLARRTEPVNVIAFENCPDPGQTLREAVLSVNPCLYDKGHGFSGALVSRIVTQRQGELEGDQPLVFLGDPTTSFIVHGPSLRKPLPRVEGLRAVEDYGAWATKKLYTFSAGHAAAAYLGALKGYRYIHSAIRDPEIRSSVVAAMEEGQRGLARRYGPDLAGDAAELEAIICRFENAALNDPVSRVGRDPRRKLGPEDRLVGAARLAEEAGVSPRRLALAAAAAICFDCGAGKPHPEAEETAETLHTVSGLDPNTGIGQQVSEAVSRIGEWREADNVLLSLKELVWSWARCPLMPQPVPLRKIG
jgi:mannitol-1-phosphate 5-dehydrogenase